MLTREILAANAILQNLSEEQVNAILTLSQNDENSVIAKKTGEIYGALDSDILAASGVAKNGIEKTYDYAKRVLAELKKRSDDADGLQSSVETLTKEKTRLEKALAEGTGDAEAAKALKQAKADLANITKEFNSLNTKMQETQAAHERELFGVRVDNALNLAAGGLKFKNGLPESVTKVILQQASEKLKGMSPEMIDDGNGGKLLAFKGEDGAILRNPNNQLNPYTAKELLTKELENMGVLEKDRQQAGGGTTAPTAQTGSGAVVDITGAKTRVEAYEAISSGLMARGLTVGSAEFDAAMSQAWKDNNISQLPEK